MVENWYLFESGLQSPALNMAMDEALLEWVSTVGQPVLRFYGWAEPAATFGYSQRYLEVAAWTQLRPLIRRPTGGGLVPHDADWTYSLAFPPVHAWYQLKAIESYRQIHEWISRAFQRLGVPTHLAPVPQKVAPGQCFSGAEKFDLLRDGAKIAGAAQRRTRSGLLIQGSVQPHACRCSRPEWESAMLQSVSSAETVIWQTLTPGGLLVERADQLAAEKYTQSSYLHRR